MTSLRISTSLILLMAGHGTLASASGIYSGTINGVFTNPALSGTYSDLNRNPVFIDNTNSAVYSGIGTNTLQWGGNPTPAPGVPTFSRLIFTGSNVSSQVANAPFVIGFITFLNGTSLTTTGIFGAELDLSFSGNGSVTPGKLQVTIVATQNGGVDPYADADYIGFSSITPGPAIPTTFNVFEGKEGTVTLVGSIVGDPQLTLTDLSLAPGDPNGFLAEGQGSAVPEPATGWLIILGLAAALFFERISFSAVWISCPR